MNLKSIMGKIKSKLWNAKEGIIISGISWIIGYALYTKSWGPLPIPISLSTYSVIGDIQVMVTQNDIWFVGLILFMIIGGIIDLNKKRMPKKIREIFKW